MTSSGRLLAALHCRVTQTKEFGTSTRNETDQRAKIPYMFMYRKRQVSAVCTTHRTFAATQKACGCRAKGRR